MKTVRVLPLGFQITPRALTQGGIAGLLFIIAFALTDGSAPEAAHSSISGLAILVVYTLLGTAGVGLILDVAWPRTHKRWHGVLLGVLVSQVTALTMYWALIPWHMTTRQLVFYFLSSGLLLGAPLGAIKWSPPPTSGC